MDFAKFHQKLRSIPNVNALALFSTDHAVSILSLYALSNAYSIRHYGNAESPPVPVDIQFKRTKTKASMRCSFPALDIAHVNNAIVDLNMEKTVSLSLNDETKTVLVFDYIIQNIEIGIQEID
jgi:hypothetical protein